jgi:uroporphyrinogen-III synthase
MKGVFMERWGDAVYASRRFTVTPWVEVKPDGSVIVLRYYVDGPGTDGWVFQTSATAIAFAKERANDPGLKWI